MPLSSSEVLDIIADYCWDPSCISLGTVDVNMILFPPMVEDIIVDYCWEFVMQYISWELSESIAANGLGNNIWITERIAYNTLLYPFDVVARKRTGIQMMALNQTATAVADNGDCYFIDPDHVSIWSFSPVKDGNGVIKKRGEMDLDVNTISIKEDRLTVSTRQLSYKVHFTIQSDGSLSPDKSVSKSTDRPHDSSSVSQDRLSPNGKWKVEFNFVSHAVRAKLDPTPLVPGRDDLDRPRSWEIILKTSTHPERVLYSQILVHPSDTTPTFDARNIIGTLWSPDSRSVVIQILGGDSIRIYFKNAFLDH